MPTRQGRYHNPWPDSEPHGIGDVLRMLTQRPARVPVPTPSRGSLPTAAPRVAYPRAAADELRVTWIGHSSVLLQVAALNILTDPVFSRRASPVQWVGPRRIMDPGLTLDRLPPIDLVLLSHNHYDHLDRPAVKRIVGAHPDARWVVAAGLAEYIRPWGVRWIEALEWWGETEVLGARITATPARHFSGRGLGDRNRSLWCGFTLAARGRRIFYAGDTAMHPEFGAVGAHGGPFDFVMIPIGAYDPRWFMRIVHVDPEEAVRVYQDLVSAHPGAPLPVMLGVHWGTFRLTSEPMDEPPRRTADCWRAAGLDEHKLWIARVGESRSLAWGNESGAEPSQG